MDKSDLAGETQDASRNRFSARGIVIGGVGLLPLVFAAVFGSLIVRAHFAFGEWPRLSGNDPWALVNRAPKDLLHPIFPYAGHINAVYLLLPFALAGVIGIPIVTLVRKKLREPIALIQIVGCLAAATLLLYQNGRFIVWFLD